MTAKAGRLFIVGAGGFGRELESWLDSVPHDTRDWQLCGYLDDNPDALNGFPSDYSILGGIDSARLDRSDRVVLAIADPAAKRKMVNRLEGRVEFFTFTAPGTRIGKHVALGRGVVIGINCILTTNVHVGDFVTINSHSAVGHDVRIESYASLMGNVMINGRCVIGEAAYVGTSANLIPGRRLGAGSVVAAGATVFRHVKARTTVIGNPARVFLDSGN